jgi:hypothetical protein
MLILEPPADTFNFMLLGFGVILGTMALFLVSLVVRFNNLRRDVMQIEELEADKVNRE